MLLNDNGQTEAARDDVWPLVKFDLEWVMENWGSEGCDLWEEVRSQNFYFNRMGYVYSLNTAADFADSIGDNSILANEYRKKADEILEATKSHWLTPDS